MGPIDAWIFTLILLAYQSSAQNLCYTPENIPGDCRSIYDCPSILAQFQSRLTNRVSNYLRSLQCQTDTGAYPFVCCAMYNNFQQPNPQTTWLTSVDRNDRTPVTSYSGAGNGGHLPAPGYCGLTSLGNRIYGGEGTQLDEYPWMALLEYRKRSLINSRYVLTAAHCLIGEIERRVGQLVGVRLGEYDITKEVDCQGNTCADPIVVMGVEQKIPHEGYNEKNKNRANDIGLIRLDSEVTFTDYVSPICLPSSVNSPRTLPTEKLVSAGWGRTRTMRQSATKQHVELPVVDHNECTIKYKMLGISINKNQLCAGGVFGYDTCDGDSGNPLMKIATNGWVVEGVVSFGRGCGLEDTPAVYTKVSNYDNWIQRNLRA